MRKQARLHALTLLLLGSAATTAATQSLDEHRPTHAQLASIAEWVAKATDLPLAQDMPRVEFVPPETLKRLRYRAFAARTPPGATSEDKPRTLAGDDSKQQLQPEREIVAIYDDMDAVIFLPSNWSGASLAAQSVLVHEMVHHLQNRARQKFACGGERERPAYIAQKLWLEQRGLDIEQEFDLDMFTIVALSVCMG